MHGEALLRITETAYVRRMHHEIPKSMISVNNKVKSLSQCLPYAGRQGRIRQRYDPHPGHEDWDD